MHLKKRIFSLVRRQDLMVLIITNREVTSSSFSSHCAAATQKWSGRRTADWTWVNRNYVDDERLSTLVIHIHIFRTNPSTHHIPSELWRRTKTINEKGKRKQNMHGSPHHRASVHFHVIGHSPRWQTAARYRPVHYHTQTYWGLVFSHFTC